MNRPNTRHIDIFLAAHAAWLADMQALEIAQCSSADCDSVEVHELEAVQS